MPRDIHLSPSADYPNGRVKQACRLEVWDDLSSPRPVAYRLFWVVPGETTGTPAVGYCEAGGSYATVRSAIADGVRRFGETAVRVR